MASGGHDNSPPPSTEHIQLQDLSSLPRRDHVSFENPGSGSTHVRTRSFGASIGRRLSMSHHQPGYDRLDNDSPQDTHHHHHLHIPTVQYEQPEPENRIADLDVPEYHYTNRDPEVYQLRREVDGALGSSVGRGSWLPRRNTVKKKAAAVEEGDATADNDNGDDAPWRPSLESDTAPLAEVANQQPMAGAEKRGPARFAPGPSLGVDMLSAAEMGLAGDEVRGTARSRSVRGGGGLSPSRSSSTAKAKRSLSVGAPVRRVSVALQNLGNRVINLGNDGVTIEQTLRRGGSAKSLAGSRATGGEGEPAGAETEKTGAAASATALPAVERPWAEQANPLKGNSLRIFSPSSRTRLILCDVLIHPVTEPFIVLLIIIQAILLTVDAVPSVYVDPRAKGWGTSGIDYAMLGLFIVYTFELIARIIVSGFVMNPIQDIHKPQGSHWTRFMHKIRKFFMPKGKRSAPMVASQIYQREEMIVPSIMRSITRLNMTVADEQGHRPVTAQSQARFSLARRAFLRHSFNRLDFVAVVSYWISLVICVSGAEAEYHLYIFRMLSCLRILRLLAITSGTTVILRSLKKAAPLLVHVAFLICFFWLVFAVIGVQSFKGSFRRTCVWVDPAGVADNYTQEFQFCGGHMDPVTGVSMPYVKANGAWGATDAKGYICPKNSLCVSGSNPYGGTVNFDDIVHSIELVFVVMTANTFSDLLYYTADSDTIASVWFFVFAIVILAFWLANLLIAVITASFQVIREETFQSTFSNDDISSVHEEEVVVNDSKIKQWYKVTRKFWVALITVGIFASAYRGSTLTAEGAERLDRIELAITFLLAVEILIRFISNPRRFHKNKRNLFDLFLAVMTCIILLPRIKNSGRAYSWLTLFQILRVYRVVWALPVTRNLIAKVLGNVTGLSNLLFFVMLLTFLVAIFAVQLLRGEIPADYGGSPTPVSFHTIANAFIGMYSIFSSEGWTSLLYMATEVQRPYGVEWISAMFFIGWFILGNFIVLNMFIAVIQENFDVSEDEKRMHQVKAFLQNKSYRAPSQGLKFDGLWGRKNTAPTESAHSKQAAFEMLTKQAIVESFLDEGEQHNRASLTKGANIDVAAAVVNLKQEEERQKRFFQRWGDKMKNFRKNKEPNPFYSFQSRTVADLAPTALAQEVVTEQDRRKRAQREYLAKYPHYNVSLFIFRPTNPIRRFCQMLVGPSRANIRYDGMAPHAGISFAFSILIYAAIVAMVILACITTPLFQKEYFEVHGYSTRNWFTLVDTGFVALFTLETIIKVIADGLVFTPNAYLRGSWGIIDCIVLITLWISVGGSLTNKDEISRAVGAFKALRALRLLNISGTAQDTFHSVVIVGGKKIVSAAFVSLSLIIPFAIFGVNLFAGNMDACNDDSGSIDNLSDCIYEYANQPFDWNVLAPRAVATPYFNFDNFGKSLFILFQIVSQEGWTGVMFNAENIVGRGRQPKPFYSEANAIFFLAFNLLGAVFVLTLFVSVFMRNYTEQTGVAFLTADQRTWLELRKLLRQVTPSKRPNLHPESKVRTWCYQRAAHKHGYWQRGFTVLLVGHLFLLLLEQYPEHAVFNGVRSGWFLALSVLFIVNIAVRVIGLTWKNYFKSKWDLYSLAATTGAFVTTLLQFAGNSSNSPVFMQTQKLFLVSIVILLIPRNDQLDHLFKTAAASLTSIGNLIATWFVLFLVYAIALTQAFGLTKIGPHGNGNMNFRSVPKALILLFSMTCGEGWNELMGDYEVSEPACVQGATFFETDCGSSIYARVLFVSWNIISMYIFVSMFISLIFESFSYVYQRSGDSLRISREEIRKFKQAWGKLDPTGTGFISKDKFPRLLGLLSGIFAMRIYDEPYRVNDILKGCRVGPDSSKSEFHEGPIVCGVDLGMLNRRVAKIPVQSVRKQRHIFTLFFEECLVSADKESGVSFESVLLILAHYRIINDNKSLRLEEYLRRRYRLQRVEEQVQRNVVTNFFLSLYWRKRFRDMKTGGITPITDLSRSGSTNIPQITIDDASSFGGSISVPTIRVDSADHPSTPPRQSLSQITSSGSQYSYYASGESSGYQSPIESPTGVAFGFGGIDPFSDDGLRQRGRRTPPPFGLSAISSPNLSPSASPQLGSNAAGAIGGWFGNPSARHLVAEVPPQIVMGGLDDIDSEWRDQIRSFIESEIGAGVVRSGSGASGKGN